MHIDDIKLFAKCEKELETLIQTIKIYSLNIGMDFVLEKCVVRSRKRQITEGIELPNQERIRMFVDKEILKYLGILKPNTIKQVQMKEKVRKWNFRRTRKLLETKACHRYLIKGIKPRLFPL